ncbi:MAG: ABC transporter ATP-binding protein [Lachnospiraceae bacterium]
MNEIMLELTDVSKTYGEGETAVHALKNVNLQIQREEFAAIIGPSGSGKSTLLHICGGLDSPTSGSILIRGTDISKLQDEKATIFRRENIGFVFQNYNLIPILTVYENIVLPIQIGGKEADTEYVEEIMKKLDLNTLKDRIPAKLSGGQQQRVAIARALATKPAIILADEPTGNLNSEAAAEVMELLTKCVREFGQTVMMITHNETLIKDCDRVFCIRDGILTEE